MTTYLLTTDTTDRELGVNDWRYQQLLHAGWPEDHALILAADHDIDLHQACDLLARGCEPALATKILL